MQPAATHGLSRSPILAAFQQLLRKEFGASLAKRDGLRDLRESQLGQEFLPQGNQCTPKYLPDVGTRAYEEKYHDEQRRHVEDGAH